MKGRRVVARLKPDQCPACTVTFQPDDAVLRLTSATVVHATHRSMFMADRIIAEGTWTEVRRSTRIEE